MDNQKKLFYDSLKQWDENLEIIWDKEEEYKKLLVDSYKVYITNAREEFKQYSKENSFQIFEKSNFIKSTYGDNYFSIRVQFYDIIPDVKYSFDLAIVESNRREFIIYIIPLVNDIYIPKLSNTLNRPRPQNDHEIKKCIKDLQEEYLFLDKQNEELKKAIFEFRYHSAERNSPNLAELESNSDFLSILKKLLKN
jgi:hypothetical protein